MNRNRKRRSASTIAAADFFNDLFFAIKCVLMIIGAGVIAFALASLFFMI
jgi:hypothetical protein